MNSKYIFMRHPFVPLAFFIVSFLLSLSLASQTTSRGRMTIHFLKFKCLNPTTDDMLETDGKGDELFFTFIYSIADSNGRTKSRGKISTKTFGDQNGFPARIQAGSKSEMGGITRGNIVFPKIEAILDRSLEVGDFISMLPLVWEWDNAGPSVQSELEAFFLNSMDSINKKLHRAFSQYPKEHQYVIKGLRLSSLIDTNRVKYILRNIKDRPATRPVGLSSTGLYPTEELYVKIYDQKRVAGYSAISDEDFRLLDKLYYDPTHGNPNSQNRVHPNGDYEIYLSPVFVAAPTGTPPPPGGGPAPPIEVKPPRPVHDSIRIKPGEEPVKDTVVQADQVQDPDGNPYTTITIGKLRWMRENLRTTRYNDGTPIAGNLSNTAWETTREGAYAVYENNNQYDATYGKLYNGYAVATGKLCPKGWRVPTDKDWQELESLTGMGADLLANIGGRGNIAGALKEPGLWDPSGEPSSNSSGFSIRPAGIRAPNGEFMVLKQYGDFWTSTVYENPYSLYLWNRHFYYNSLEIGRNYLSASNGYSCRCVQDVTQ